jgi:hypothetical protein
LGDPFLAELFIAQRSGLCCLRPEQRGLSRGSLLLGVAIEEAAVAGCDRDTGRHGLVIAR